MNNNDDKRGKKRLNTESNTSFSDNDENDYDDDNNNNNNDNGINDENNNNNDADDDASYYGTQDSYNNGEVDLYNNNECDYDDFPNVEINDNEQNNTITSLLLTQNSSPPQKLYHHHHQETDIIVDDTTNLDVDVDMDIDESIDKTATIENGVDDENDTTIDNDNEDDTTIVQDDDDFYDSDDSDEYFWRRYDTTTTLKDRREQNIKRNQQRMNLLGFENSTLSIGTSSQHQQKKVSMNKKKKNNPTKLSRQANSNMYNKQQPLGMLLAKSLRNIQLTLKTASSSLSNNSNNNNNNTDHNDCTKQNRSPNNQQQDEVQSSSIEQKLQRLCNDFPGRTRQINRLYSLLDNNNNTTLCNHNHTVGVLPPIFMTGPSGTGKTSIIRRVVQSLVELSSTSTLPFSTIPLQSPTSESHLPVVNNHLVDAYINCQINYGNINTIATSIYSQFEKKLESLLMQCSNASSNLSMGSFMNPEYSYNIENPNSEQVLTGTGSLNRKNVVSRKDDKAKLLDTANLAKLPEYMLFDDVNDCDINVAAIDDWERHVETKQVRYSHQLEKHNRQQRQDVVQFKSELATKAFLPSVPLQQTSTSQKMILKLGRALQELFDEYINIFDQINCNKGSSKIGNISAVLVLDHIESLQILGQSSISKVEWLTQILEVLPHTLNVNISIVVISNIRLLELSTLHDGAKASIADKLAPITIHFHALHEEQLYKKILSSDEAKIQIKGYQYIENTHLSSTRGTKQLEDLLFASFVDIVVHSLLEYSTDTKEYMRYAKVLWPMYVKPFQIDSVHETITTIMKRVATTADERSLTTLPENTKSFLNQPSIQNTIIELVTRRIQSTLRYMVDHGPQSLILDTAYLRPSINQCSKVDSIVASSNNVSLQICDSSTLRKCLLLAVYSCHRNSAKLDKFLQDKRCDKRRGRDFFSSMEDEQTDGSTSRSRIFSLRRLMVSYENIVRRVIEKRALVFDGKQHNTNDNLLANLLSDQIEESLLFLCEVGIINDIQKGSTKRLIQSGYWCSMNEECARDIAESLELDFEFNLD